MVTQSPFKKYLSAFYTTWTVNGKNTQNYNVFKDAKKKTRGSTTLEKGVFRKECNTQFGREYVLIECGIWA